ncbi:hypothetical protein K502DRAFT_317448 [Neoconidiobolus thromboides FSU 785]|nr:hypothetical protein K502DRAFT_317448 [Neoconidiobolus thromboides FSU 785]
MALYHKFVFGLLVSEIITYIGLMIPLPNTMRQRMLVWIKNNVISRVQYTLKIVGVFIFILFIDSINGLNKALEKGEITEGTVDVRTDTSIQVKKFFAQRNVYLCGITMFLSFILNYTFEQIIELLNTKEKLTILESNAPNGSEISQKFDEQVKELDRLNDELLLAKEKSADFDNLKKKIDDQQKEYSKIQEEIKKAKAA